MSFSGALRTLIGNARALVAADQIPTSLRANGGLLKINDLAYSNSTNFICPDHQIDEH